MRQLSARIRITALAALAAGIALPAAGIGDLWAADLKAADYRLSGPYTHGNLTLYMIHGKPGDTGKPPLTLQEALQRGFVRVRETGNVDQLDIENVGDQDIFVQAGDIVKGGKQDRVVQLDLVLAPRSGRIPLAAFCVEAGRWAARGTEDVRQFSSATTSLPSKDLKLAARGVPARPDARPDPEPRDPHERRQIARRAPADSQGRVWAGVAEMQRKLSDSVQAPVAAAASASSLQLSLENQKLQATIRETVAALTPSIDREPDVIGYVFAINGRINSAEVYGSGGLFRKMWPKLLHASAVEALSERKAANGQAAPTIDAVRAFLVESEAGRPSDRRLPAEMKLTTLDSDKAVVFESRKAGAAAPVRRSYVSK
ncbi:MAG: hypothetical protein KF889_27035 [Alphaproteobacteria bacterium]|nr:hypothetical protein [Alphaproteobacteria bacterium]MCW5738647.1 hypothetical protein [Alphaproteobacteria bacterium]